MRKLHISAFTLSLLCFVAFQPAYAADAVKPAVTAETANTKDVQALFTKGVMLAESQKREEAIKVFTEITEKYPNLPEPYNNLAVLYADLGQYEKAKNALERAIKTHPSYATAHENLGDIYAKMASEAYDKALQLDNSNARAENKLAMIKELFSGSKSAMVAKAAPKTVALPDVKPTNPVKPAAVAVVTDTKPAVEPARDSSQDISNAVYAWAKAWSSKNVNAYLANYSDTFKTPKGEARKAWEEQRRERVGRAEPISVDIANLKVKMDTEDKATVSFNQTYKAGRAATIRTSKVLKMRNVDGKWLIDQEIAK